MTSLEIWQDPEIKATFYFSHSDENENITEPYAESWRRYAYGKNRSYESFARELYEDWLETI